MAYEKDPLSPEETRWVRSFIMKTATKEELETMIRQRDFRERQEVQVELACSDILGGDGYGSDD